MDTQILIGALAGFAVACLLAVIWVLARRQPTITDELPDVVELAHELASLKKQVRRAYMQSVRAGESGAPVNSIPVQAPPELQAAEPSPPTAAQDLKAKLRAAVLSSPVRGRGH